MGTDAIDLKETMAANPLDKAVSNIDNTALAQEGILTAAAAETDAINQYTQILNLLDDSEDWLKQAATETIKDIVAEEKKHFAQLYAVVSKLPAFKEESKAGEKEAETGEDTEAKEENKEEAEDKEPVEEAVATPENQYNTYDLDMVERIIVSASDLAFSREEVDNKIDELGIHSIELSPYEVDKILASFNFEPELLDYIERQIVEKADIEKNNNAQASADLADDIQTLEDLLQDNHLFSDLAKSKVRELIDELKNL